MSSDSPPPPQDPVRKTTEEITNFVQWLAELIRSRNWFILLLLIEAVLILFFTPGGVVPKFLKEFFSLTLPDNYPTFFWLTVGLIFVVALIVAVRTMPRQSKTDAVDVSERKAIKGLRPFSFDDAEIFARLQRGRSLHECFESVTSSTFRFGILIGESGCGKTSFLQAGLLPKLSSPEDSHRGIYIRFADRDPLDTIRKALVEQLQLPDNSIETDFLKLLSRGVEAASKPLVLMFDQFEQFFVHFKQTQDRQPFVAALATWYRSPDPLPVKILVCIRGDLSDRLVELHHALGYSLGPQEVFRLDKFAPSEAEKNLLAIAEIEKLKFDQRFVTELAAQELASREDGLISPVDLQILAWMIDRQSADELRAFNRQAFQKIGGVEGLLTRFLDRPLEARVTTAQRQVAVKVLLALTDLDRRVRAGVLTVADLQAKLRETMKPDEVEEATTWLARGDVRLITPMEQDGTVGYELAHERIIPALMRLAGKELSQADQANQLLDRRVNEWLGNQRSSRYLLTWRELWLIEQQKPYLIWGANRSHKESLLSRSKNHFYRVIGIIATVLLAIAVYSSWLFSPWGQIWQVRRELANLIMNKRVSSELTVKAAIALAKDTETVGKLNNPQKAAVLLQQALDSAGKIENPSDKAWTLSALAEAIGKLNNPQKAAALLQQALDSAGKIEDSSAKASALSTLAQAQAKLGNWRQAREAVENCPSDECKVNSLAAILTIHAEQKNPALAETLPEDE